MYYISAKAHTQSFRFGNAKRMAVALPERHILGLYLKITTTWKTLFEGKTNGGVTSRDRRMPGWLRGYYKNSIVAPK